MPFQTPYDVVNRGLQHLGQPPIVTFADITRAADEMSNCFDKLRAAELQKLPWRFATRRAYVWPFTATTLRFVPAAWAASTAYALGQIVMDSSGVYWTCQYAHTSSATTGVGTNAPGYALVGQPAYWQQYFGPVMGDLYSSGTTYNAGDIVYTGSSPYAFFVSLINVNVGNATTGSDWQNISGSGNTTALPQHFILPAGPQYATTRTIYPLPNGFLRMTAPDGKKPNQQYLTASAGLRFLDWEPENTYFVSSNTTPLLLRFIGDISDVLSMSPLFCETWAASLAMATCEPLTQSQEKYARVQNEYTTLFNIAEQVNYLETGSSEVQAAAMVDDSQANKMEPQPAPRGRGAS